jgi:phosphonopyruvate decarboxylase
MSIYVVPTSKAGKWLEHREFIVATDEGEAVAMACGEYMATGKVSTVVMGENGLLNALDSLLSLAQLHNIPIDLILFPREDEPQHKMVTDHLRELLDLYNIKAEIK